MKITFAKIAFSLIALVLVYFLYETVMTPIRFNKIQQQRYEATIERLKDVRTAQRAYRSVKGEYAGHWDTLINFIKNDSFFLVKKTGEYSQDDMTEAEALRLGYILRDTIKIAVIDSLLKNYRMIDSLRYVPYTGGDTFTIGSGVIETGARVDVQVFEAAVPDSVLLDGLNPQLIINFSERREKMTGYPGLRVGSLTEATNDAGNWE